MNKTIAEILTPKPEARPRIYAYSIDDKEHAKAPTARPKLSPGHRPGYSNRNPNPALKGRLIHYQQNQMQNGFGRFVSPFQGCWILLVPVPRALPWAFMECPFGAETVAPTARPKLSPGHRPGYSNRNPNPALKGRLIHHQQTQMQNGFGRFGSPLQGCWILFVPFPRALPWAGISRPFGADFIETTQKDGKR